MALLHARLCRAGCLERPPPPCRPALHARVPAPPGRYEGEFEDNSMSGYGVYVWGKEGSVYRGQASGGVALRGVPLPGRPARWRVRGQDQGAKGGRDQLQGPLAQHRRLATVAPARQGTRGVAATAWPGPCQPLPNCTHGPSPAATEACRLAPRPLAPPTTSTIIPTIRTHGAVAQQHDGRLRREDHQAAGDGDIPCRGGGVCERRVGACSGCLPLSPSACRWPCACTRSCWAGACGMLVTLSLCSSKRLS